MHADQSWKAYVGRGCGRGWAGRAGGKESVSGFEHTRIRILPARGGGGGGGGERENAMMPAGDGDGARGASVAGGSVGGDKGDGVGEDGWHSKRLWASYKQLVRDVRAIYYYLRYVHDLELAQNPQIPCGDLAGLRPNSMTNGFFNIYVYMFIIYILLLFYYYFREKVKRESLGRLCEALEASI